MSEPLAYFLTWHTYGTWLHGDERGSVDDNHNQPGAPMLLPNPKRQRGAERLLKCEPLILSDVARHLVAETFVDHCRIRHWNLLAKSIRTNHVHAVIENAGVTPERMLRELKGYSTRKLRGAGIIAKIQKVWVHHGSTRYLWLPNDIDAAIAYVELGQD